MPIGSLPELLEVVSLITTDEDDLIRELKELVGRLFERLSAESQGEIMATYTSKERACLEEIGRMAKRLSEKD